MFSQRRGVDRNVAHVYQTGGVHLEHAQARAERDEGGQIDVASREGESLQRAEGDIAAIARRIWLCEHG